MQSFKSQKIIFYSLFLLVMFFLPLAANATTSEITETIVDGMKKVSFKSDCTKYTLSGWGGESGTQLPQSFYYNPSTTGIKNLIWFQHGDGSAVLPKNACENRFYATKVLTHEKGKNFIIFCPEMNPSNGSTAEGNKKAFWSANYASFFKCLYEDFKSTAQGKGINLSENTIIASHSQGGPATSKITTEKDLNRFSFIKIVGILRFDSCYKSQCESEANVDVAKRGPLIAYVSDVSATPYKNNDANKDAVIDKKIWNEPSVTAYLLVGKNHTQVPQLCTLDFLNHDSCGGTAKFQGGTSPAIATTGGATAANIGSITVPGNAVFSETEVIMKTPQLQISLPGLKFTSVKQVEEGGNKFIMVPFLGEYLAAIYKYTVAVASIIAIVMIIIAGFKMVVSGGNQEQISKAKKEIVQAFTGLLLAVGSYVILYTINPSLVEFKNLKVLFVKEQPFPEGEGYGQPAEEELSSADTLNNLSQIPKGKASQDCGKNMDKIAEAYASIVPHIGLESCSCAWFVSRVLSDSGCTSAQLKTNTNAKQLRLNLLNAPIPWKEIPLTEALPGDVVFYVKLSEDEQTQLKDEKGNLEITHATVFYKSDGSKKYIIDANTNFRYCWTDEQRAAVINKCDNGKDTNYKASKKLMWGVIPGKLDGKIFTQTADKDTSGYQKCIASLGICPILEDYRPDLCVSMSLITARAPKLDDHDASESCYTRQCIKVQQMTNPSKTKRYSVLKNPFRAK